MNTSYNGALANSSPEGILTKFKFHNQLAASHKQTSKYQDMHRELSWNGIEPNYGRKICAW